MVAKEAATLQEEMAMQRHLLAQGMTPGASGDGYAHPNIVAASKAMRMVLQQVSQVGPSRATVLLRGESGTGKELLAEAIHSVSPRTGKPLVKLNCAALPADLVESELFGHQKGAFTGAVANKKGMFELAHGGTLFLDEIGELPLDAQAKVLRAVQEREIQRLGSEQVIHVDVRLICATNRSLEKMLEEGTFREDLFYRINVFPIFIPPCARAQAGHPAPGRALHGPFRGEYGKSVKRISTPAIDLLAQYHWPGNVRELGNCMERAVLVCDEEVIRTYHLPPSLQTAESSATDTSLSFGEAVARFEQELLVDALKKSRGNMLQAARDLKASYRIVNYKVKKYRIDSRKYAVARPRNGLTASRPRGGQRAGRRGPRGRRLPRALALRGPEKAPMGRAAGYRRRSRPDRQVSRAPPRVGPWRSASRRASSQAFCSGPRARPAMRQQAGRAHAAHGQRALGQENQRRAGHMHQGQDRPQGHVARVQQPGPGHEQRNGRRSAGLLRGRRSSRVIRASRWRAASPSGCGPRHPESGPPCWRAGPYPSGCRARTC
jgi:DNA-binding NtrC family response regulator